MGKVQLESTVESDPFPSQLPATTWLQERLGELLGSILDLLGHFEQ